MRTVHHAPLWLAVAGHAALLWPLLAMPEQPPRLAAAPVMTVSLLAPLPAPAPQVAPPSPVTPVARPVPTLRMPAREAPRPEPRALPEAAKVAPAAPAPSPSAQPAAPQAPAQTSAAPPPAPVAAPVMVEARFDAAYLNNPKPAYPPLARRLGEEGQVLLRAYVNADGAPEQIELRRSSGSPRLDAAAQETVRRWRFVPARRGDAPIAAWVLIPINFRLDS